MIDLNLIKNFFPEQIRNNTLLGKSMMKEYIQLLILDYLSTTQYVRKLTFIGGTCLRLVKGIDRFSEDLDFDCKEINKDESAFALESNPQASFSKQTVCTLHNALINKPKNFIPARFILSPKNSFNVSDKIVTLLSTLVSIVRNSVGDTILIY